MLNISILLIFIMILWATLIEPNLIEIKYYKIKNLPFDKIVFVTDFHLRKQEKRRLAHIIELINKLKPDIVLSAGDYIKNHNISASMPISAQAALLNKIKAPFVTVLGNHDTLYYKAQVIEEFRNNGILVLDNSCVQIKDVYIAGVQDKKNGFPDINLALKKCKSPVILLTHSPDIYYDVKENVALILAGHVHGGQIRLPFIGALTVPSKFGVKFSSGIIQETHNTMIISKGLGTSILPLRFFCKPEISVIEKY